MKPLLKIKEAAQLLKVHPHHLYRLIGKKAVPYLKIPGVGIRFELESLQKWIQEAKIDPEDWSEILRR